MYTASSKGFWFRTHSEGAASAWAYSAGPRFLVDMHCYGYGRHIACWIDGRCVDETHLVNRDDIRGWIDFYWRWHVDQLSGHEKMEYIEIGLLQEAD